MSLNKKSNTKPEIIQNAIHRDMLGVIMRDTERNVNVFKDIV